MRMTFEGTSSEIGSLPIAKGFRAGERFESVDIYGYKWYVDRIEGLDRPDRVTITFKSTTPEWAARLEQAKSKSTCSTCGRCPECGSKG